MAAYLHYSMATFFERHGQQRPSTRVVANSEWTTTVLSEDPWRIQVETTIDETIRHVVDGELNVVEWSVST
jgi:hypothetical protein